MKCLPTLHPAALMRDPVLWGVVVADLARAREESADPALREEPCVIHHITTKADCHKALRALRGPAPTALDIETVGDRITCVGLCQAPPDVYVIEWDALDRIDFDKWLRRHTVLIHNALFDVERLEADGFTVPHVHDTMLLHHAVYCELPHSLAFVASVYTRLRYWKNLREAPETEIDK